MKHIFRSLLLIGLVMAVGCSKDSDSLTPAQHEYQVFLGQDLLLISDTLANDLIVKHYELVSGPRMVFKALYVAPQDDGIFDDDYSETLWFAVDSTLTEFYYEDEELEQTLAYFVMSGAWVPNKPFEVRDGSIEGRKISRDYWEVWVNAEVETTDNYRIKISLHDLFKIVNP
jgi:hypothetical protein